MPGKTSQSTQAYPNRTAEGVLQKIIERWQLPQSGSERTCTTGPGSQASRWAQIQLHREGVIDVGDMMRVYLM